jgi:hypothetical protein
VWQFEQDSEGGEVMRYPIWAEGLTDEDREIIATRGVRGFERILGMLRGDEYDHRLMRNAARASHPSSAQRMVFLAMQPTMSKAELRRLVHQLTK